MLRVHEDGETLAPCPGCGQLTIEPAHFGPCEECAAAEYGGRERHEAMRLFAPVAAPLPGQLEI